MVNQYQKAMRVVAPLVNPRKVKDERIFYELMKSAQTSFYSGFRVCEAIKRESLSDSLKLVGSESCDIRHINYQNEMNVLYELAKRMGLEESKVSQMHKEIQDETIARLIKLEDLK